MAALAAELLHGVRSGRPVGRHEAVRLARAVLESRLVRAAEAVLEADDAHLVARVTDLAATLLESEQAIDAEARTR